MKSDGKDTGDIKSISTSDGLLIKKNDIVLLGPEKKKMMALVLDTNKDWSYIVYIDDRASQAQPEPFWIFTDCLRLCGE